MGDVLVGQARLGEDQDFYEIVGFLQRFGEKNGVTEFPLHATAKASEWKAWVRSNSVLLFQ